ncbi:MAG: hypothetical protein HQM00_00045 [Magnetococcales bacterium]|nr:hypothetical protein [Magnetococcales bacterium]
MAVLMRVLNPDMSGISEGNDTTLVDGQEVKRFNLLGYESNSLAAMVSLLLHAGLGKWTRFPLLIKISYTVGCLLVTLATFSRTGLVSVVLVLFWNMLYNKSSLIVVSMMVSGAVFAVPLFADIEPLVDAVIARATNMNYLNNERGEILLDRLAHMLNDDWVLMFGSGFMRNDAYDNSFLAVIHSYGLFGAFLVSLFLVLTLGARWFRVFSSMHMMGMLIPFTMFMIAGDIFGQAKIITVFFVLVAVSLARERALHPGTIPTSSIRGV